MEETCSELNGTKSIARVVDVGRVQFNPLYRAFKSASFTYKDITFHFMLMDVLGGNRKSFSLSEIIKEIDEHLKFFFCSS